MKPVSMALAAVGGYLLWNNRGALGIDTAAAPGVTGGGADDAAAKAAEAAKIAAGAGSGGFNATAPVKPSDSVLMRAATNAQWIGPAGNFTQNLHQWNWYRAQYQIQVANYPGHETPDPAQYTPTWDDLADPSKQYTAAEYQALLAKKGLAGLSGLGALGAAAVSAAIQEAARAARTQRADNCGPFGMFKLPDGACTAVDPSKWAWQCEPGIGTEASCVGIPEDTFVPSSQVGLLPSIPAPAPPITRVFRENTDPYALWPSCHDRGPALWNEEIPGCTVLGPTGAALPVEEEVFPLDVDGGVAPCLLLAFVMGAAALDVMGARR